MSLEGVRGTEHLPPGQGRAEIILSMWGNPELGVLLQYARYGGGDPSSRGHGAHGGRAGHPGTTVGRDQSPKRSPNGRSAVAGRLLPVASRCQASRESFATWGA